MTLPKTQQKTHFYFEFWNFLAMECDIKIPISNMYFMYVDMSWFHSLSRLKHDMLHSTVWPLHKICPMPVCWWPYPTCTQRMLFLPFLPRFLLKIATTCGTWHISLKYMQLHFFCFQFFLNPCFSNTYSIIMCLEVSGHSLIILCGGGLNSSSMGCMKFCGPPPLQDEPKYLLSPQRSPQTVHLIQLQLLKIQ